MKKELTTKEAGRLGGKKVLKKYGKEHFSKLAKASHAPTAARTKTKRVAK